MVPAAGGPARVLTASLDRNVVSPAFSRDGRDVLFLLEDDRVYHLARVPVAGGAVERLVEGQRAVTDLSVGRDGRIAVAGERRGHAERGVRRRGARRFGRSRTRTPTGCGGAARRRRADLRAEQDGTEIHGFMREAARLAGGPALPDDPPHPRRSRVAVLLRLRQPGLAGACRARIRGRWA